MICKNCSAEFDGKLSACPECGTEAEAMTRPEAEEPESSDVEEKAADEADEAEAKEAEADTRENAEAAKEADNGQPEEAKEADKGEEITQEPEEDADKKPEKKDAENRQAEYIPAGEPPERERTRPQLKKIKMTREQLIREQRRRAFIIVIMCLVACLTVAVTVLRFTTDIFDNDGESEKVVAGIAFTSQEESELEELIAKSFSVSRDEFSEEGITAETFLKNIQPGDSGNIYSVLNGVNEPLQTEADPAERFFDENGSYAYYKLEESRVDKVLSLFGLEALRGENTENYYYCDGFYYFAAAEEKATPVVGAEIVKSRIVLDGSFYVEARFYAEKNGETVKTDSYHFVVEKAKDDATGESIFTLKRVSKKPIFGSDGKLVDGAVNAVRQKKVIEGRTDDGKLYYVYTLEFPVVEGEGEGYVNLNEFFKNAVSVYELRAESASQAYTEFKNNGGDVSRLPMAENLVASVVFEDEEKLSFKVEISSYSPEAGAEQTPADGVYKRSVEAYTFDKASGNFVSKDDVLGKNYMLIGEILYRIYGGYDYESLLPEENEEEEAYAYDDVPADTEGIGAKIYESAWACTEQGVTFFLVTEKGYVTEVTIPSAVIEKIK